MAGIIQWFRELDLSGPPLTEAEVAGMELQAKLKHQAKDLKPWWFQLLMALAVFAAVMLLGWAISALVWFNDRPATDLWKFIIKNSFYIIFAVLTLLLMDKITPRKSLFSRGLKVLFLMWIILLFFRGFYNVEPEARMTEHILNVGKTIMVKVEPQQTVAVQLRTPEYTIDDRYDDIVFWSVKFDNGKEINYPAYNNDNEHSCPKIACFIYLTNKEQKAKTFKLYGGYYN